MFSGLKVLFSGGITSAQLKVFTKRFVEKSGVVSVREKIHPMFKPKALKPLENDLNYIIIENRKITSSDLCRQLNCPDIPQEIIVLHREWVEQCLNRKSLVDVSDYIVDVSAVPEDVVESSVEGLSSKRKRSDDDNETSRTSQCESVESRPKQQLKVMEFQYSKATIPSEEEFNTILSDSGKPSLLYKLCPVPRANFNRVIAFDMDGTLITTKSGATFSKSIDDWKFLYPNVPAVLRQEYESGAHLAIISNQNGVSQGHTTVTELTKKLRAIVDAIGVPMDILCAFENDIYRKPRIGSFEFLLNQRVSETQEGVSSGSVASRDPDLLARCIYVGDAAGRPKQGTRKKDFSASDYKMALNANIGFQTPEEFFLNSKQPLHCNRSVAELGPSWQELIDANRSLKTVTMTSSGPTSEIGQAANVPEVLLLVGPPACGKSTLARSLQHTHVRVNQDLLKTRKVCLKVATDHFVALKKGDISAEQPQGIVVDATNANRGVRKEWIDFAKENSVPIRCIQILATKDLCFHLAAFRILSPLSLPEDNRKIEQVVVHSYFKHMESPSLQEGLISIEQRRFSPEIPEEAEAARLLMSYLK